MRFTTKTTKPTKELKEILSAFSDLFVTFVLKMYDYSF